MFVINILHVVLRLIGEAYQLGYDEHGFNEKTCHVGRRASSLIQNIAVYSPAESLGLRSHSLRLLMKW